MQWVILIMGIGLVVWGAVDCITGTAFGANRWGAPTKYTAKEMGVFFYLIAAAKAVGGAYLIWKVF